MVRRATVVLPLAAALCAVPAAARAEPPPGWALGELPNACMLQSVSPQGTMLSIWGFAGQARFGVLLQNRGWSALRDGERHTLSLKLAGQRAWPVQATARTPIDADGPGFFFTLAPGDPDDDAFLESFSNAEEMHIARDGHSVATLPLPAPSAAMSALARCLAERWDAAVPLQKAGAVEATGATAI